MNSLSDGLLVRAVEPEHDVPAIARLLEKVGKEAKSDPTQAEAAVRASFAWPGHDPALDRWVVLSADGSDRILGHGLIWKLEAQPDADVAIAVDPAWRARGLSTALLDRIRGRAKELGASSLRAYADEDDRELNQSLVDSGFKPHSAFVEMSVVLKDPPSSPELPPGFEVRSYDQIEDLELLAKVVTDAYSGQWGHHVATPDEVATWLSDLQKDGIFILFRNGEAIGTCRAELPGSTEPETAPRGIIDAPGVVPALRSSGLQVPLLVRAMSWLFAHGRADMHLQSWGDTELDLDKYRRLGFTQTRRSISYRFDL